MKIKNILVIAAIVTSILGLDLIFMPTEIGITLLGVILLTAGIMLSISYVVYRGPSKIT